MSNTLHTYTIRITDEDRTVWPVSAIEALGFCGGTVRARSPEAAAVRVMKAARSVARKSGEYIADDQLTVTVSAQGSLARLQEAVGPGPGQRWRGQEP